MLEKDFLKLVYNGKKQNDGKINKEEKCGMEKLASKIPRRTLH